MVLNWLKNRAKKRHVAEKLYKIAAIHARHPVFYQRLMVPDSMSGRYELLCLHIFLLLERLRAENTDTSKKISRSLTDILLEELEHAYRDNGFQDSSITENIKKLIGGFYERTVRYREAVQSGNKTKLSNQLNQYIFWNKSNETRQPEYICAEHLALYILAAHAHLQTTSMKDITMGQFSFLSPVIDGDATNPRL